MDAVIEDMYRALEAYPSLENHLELARHLKRSEEPYFHILDHARLRYLEEFDEIAHKVCPRYDAMLDPKAVDLFDDPRVGAYLGQLKTTRREYDALCALAGEDLPLRRRSDQKAIGRLKDVTLGEHHVTHLNLYGNGNKLTHLPPELAALPYLTHLNLSHNHLRSLAGFPPLPRLETLDLSHTHLRSLRGLPEIPSLKRLGISGTTIPANDPIRLHYKREGVRIYGP